MSMNLQQTRVIDPILTKVVRGFSQGNMIGRFIFPNVPVTQYGGAVIEFGKESFKRINTRRAPGSATKRISFGYEGKPYSIVPNALESLVPRERMRDASQVPGIDLATRSLSLTSSVLALSHEHECADLALNKNNYGADNKVAFTALNSWATPDSDPIADIDEAKEAIRASIGIEPNRLVLSPAAFGALKRHPKLIERIKYTKAESITLEMLKSLLEIDDIKVGKAISASDSAAGFTDVWKKDAWLGYVNDNPNPSLEVPSFGYGYQIEGHPMVEKPYYAEDIKSWVYGVSDDCSPVIAGAGAGYLFENAGLK